jgi:TRAP-type C4-dicarboxylate transport system substrate-binding protein
MIKNVMRFAVLAGALLPAVASAEPVRLKLAYFSSDTSATYFAMGKPFVDAVNAEAPDVLQIDVAFSGALGKDPTKQLQLVEEGKADMAVIIPGYTPERFPDNAVLELPGLYKSMREVTMTYTGLIAANELRGYENLYVIGSYANEPEQIHSRKPMPTLKSLQGLRIRVNNPIQGAALERLGMVPVRLPINHTASAISADKVDGAMVVTVAAIEFGIARVAANHYLLGVSSPPLALVMSRAVFDKLPPQAQKIVQKFSGRWAAERYIENAQSRNDIGLDGLKRDPERKVVIPSQADAAEAQAAFDAEVKEWAAADPQHQKLLARAEAELARVRAASVSMR